MGDCHNFFGQAVSSEVGSSGQCRSQPPCGDMTSLMPKPMPWSSRVTSRLLKWAVLLSPFSPVNMKDIRPSSLRSQAKAHCECESYQDLFPSHNPLAYTRVSWRQEKGPLRLPGLPTAKGQLHVESGLLPAIFLNSFGCPRVTPVLCGFPAHLVICLGLGSLRP